VNHEVLVVGAGFAGSVVAQRLAVAGWKALVIDRRNHIGGNCYDEYDEYGVLVHRHGGHIFHTNMPQVVQYLSQFTEWRPYEHRVRAWVDGKMLPFPINLDTINLLYDLHLDEEGARAFLDRAREPRDPILTSEDVVVNAIGWDLYEKFYRNYNRKHWGLDPSELSASVAARIPVRTNQDDRYFEDEFQAMPLEGFTRLFERMLDHENISVLLDTDFADVRNEIRADHTVYTGPIDEYFGYCFGRLAYRSLRIEREHIPGTRFYLPVGTVNCPNDHAYNRVAEFKHMTGQQHSGTTIARDYPTAEGEPYYPIPCPDTTELYRKYKALMDGEHKVTIVGRLAEYRYYNMDQVVDAAMRVADLILGGENV
jgi:UDP-galactopyranose mutase